MGTRKSVWTTAIGAALLAAVTIVGTAHAAQKDMQAKPATPKGNPGEWFSRDNYPPDAIREGRQGWVIMQLSIDRAGRVTDCRVDVSSGTPSLDETSCVLMRQKGSFNPATDDRGRPIASEFTFPVRWTLDDAGNFIDAAKPIAWQTTSEWVIAPDGTIESCRSIARSGAGAPDDCARFPVGGAWGATYVRDGKPVRVVVRDSYTRAAHVEEAKPQP